MPVSRFQKIVTHFFRAVSVVMIPIAATVPSVSTQVTSGMSPVTVLELKGQPERPQVFRISTAVCLKKSQMFCLCVCLNLVAFGIFLFKEQKENSSDLKGLNVLHVV